MQVITYPHPTLRHKSKPVRRVDAELRQMISRMFELMYESKGIGLAANQVDLPLRLFIVNLAGEQGKGEELVFLNPVVSSPKGSEAAEEGCLSLPGLYADVIRPKTVRVNAYNLKGEELVADISGMMARVVQHELDHLNGVLFFDRLSANKQVELRSVLDEFETEFTSRRGTGEIPNDSEIQKRLADLEARYC